MSERKTIKFSEFPETIELSDSAIRAQDLLEQAVAVKSIIAEYEKQMDELLDELEEIQQVYVIPGMRTKVDGVEWGFASQTVVGRRTLDKVLLMERAGVTKQQLDQCMKTGKESTRRTLRKVGDKEWDEGSGAARSED